MRLNSADEPILAPAIALSGDDDEEDEDEDEWEDKFGGEEEPEVKGKRHEEDEAEEFSLFDWEEEYA